MGEIRGMKVAESNLYLVIDGLAFKVDTSGAKTYLGVLNTTSGPVTMDSNGSQVMIADGTDGYIITMATEAFQQITDADFPGAGSVTFQDGFFIVNDPGTGRLYISGSYDGLTWEALEFATAEADPDDLLRVLSDHREAWCFGSDTTEIYYNSGDADFPFARIAGGILEEGIAAAHSAAKVAGTICWLSKKGQVLKVEGYTPSIISTPQIEYQFAQFSDTSDAIGFGYTKDGHAFYILTFPTDGETWAVDLSTGFWHELESYVDADTRGRWRGQCYAHFNGKHLVGDYTNGKIYELDDAIYTDNFHSIRRNRRAQSINKNRLKIKHHVLEVEFESGVGVASNPTADAWSAATTYDGDEYCVSGGKYYISLLDNNLNNEPPDADYWEEIEADIWTGDDPQAALSWSDDGGHTLNTARNKAMGASAAYSKRAKWKKLKSSIDRVYDLEMVAPVKTVVISAHLRATEGAH